jgi:hypothetical protein
VTPRKRRPPRDANEANEADERLVLGLALAGHRRQGIHPAQARPAHLRHVVGIPIIQLILFGFAINSDPKHLPTAALIADRSEFSRSILAGLRNTDYFAFIGEARDEADANRMLATGEAQFVISIPADFSQRLVRGERPALLVEADATDPVATGNAIGAVQQLAQTVLSRDLVGPLASLARRRGHPRPCRARLRRPRPLQPGGGDGVQHRPRPDGRDPDRDHGDDDRPRDHARARARHDGKPDATPATAIEIMTERSCPTSSSGCCR